jgi:hypothetical protein
MLYGTAEAVPSRSWQATETAIEPLLRHVSIWGFTALLFLLMFVQCFSSGGEAMSVTGVHQFWSDFRRAKSHALSLQF